MRTDLGYVNKEKNQFDAATAAAWCELSTTWTFLPLPLGVNELLGVPIESLGIYTCKAKDSK